MEMLSDNVLLETWNNNSNKNVQKYNTLLETKYLRLTNNMDLQKGVIVSTREITSDLLISLVYKRIKEEEFVYPIYSFVMFDISASLPPEKSRISKYCIYKSENFDIMETIINYKLNSIMNTINVTIDEKFKSLMNLNFKSIKYKLGNKQLVDILIKPETPEFIPSMSNIILSQNSKLLSSNNNNNPKITKSDVLPPILNATIEETNAKKEKNDTVVTSHISENIYTEDLNDIMFTFENSRIEKYNAASSSRIIL